MTLVQFIKKNKHMRVSALVEPVLILWKSKIHILLFLLRALTARHLQAERRHRRFPCEWWPAWAECLPGSSLSGVWRVTGVARGGWLPR